MRYFVSGEGWLIFARESGAKKLCGCASLSWGATPTPQTPRPCVAVLSALHPNLYGVRLLWKGEIAGFKLGCLRIICLKPSLERQKKPGMNAGLSPVAVTQLGEPLREDKRLELEAPD